jgi:Fe-S-cluster containining protein
LAFHDAKFFERNMRRDALPQALAEVRAVYADLAKRPVVRSCVARTECCQFQLTGQTPYLTKGEALVAAKGFRATGRKALPAAPDGACPLLNLDTGKCLIYADRPFGCRTHFCAAAGGPYPRKQVLDLIRRLEAVDQQLGGAGPRKIQAAVIEALEALR